MVQQYLNGIQAGLDKKYTVINNRTYYTMFEQKEEPLLDPFVTGVHSKETEVPERKAIRLSSGFVHFMNTSTGTETDFILERMWVGYTIFDHTTLQIYPIRMECIDLVANNLPQHYSRADLHRLC